MLKFFKVFKNLWNQIKKSKSGIQLEKSGSTEYQFHFVEIAGKRYKELEGNLIDYPCERAQSAYTILQEYEQRATMEFIKATLQAVKLDLNKGNLVHAATLVTQLEDRMTSLPTADLIYKLASIIYIDENESFFSYDFEYNKKKIAFWRSLKIDDFFLSMPIRKYLPDLQSLGIDLESYLTGGNLNQLIQLEKIIEAFSPSLKPSDVDPSFIAQIEILLKSSNLNSLAFTNITNWLNQLETMNLK